MSWIRALAMFMIFIPLIYQLVPNEAYQKYLSYFVGLLLILIVIRPLGETLDLEEWMEKKWQGYEEAIESDENRQTLVISDAVSCWSKEKIQNYVKTLAKNEQLQVNTCKEEINQQIDSPQYGQITYLEVQIKADNTSQEKENVDRFKEDLEQTFSLTKSQIKISCV